VKIITDGSGSGKVKKIEQNHDSGFIVLVVLCAVVDGYPVFPSGFNTDIFAVVFGQPICQSPEITGECGKPAPFVRCDAFAIGCRDTSDDKGFVDINATTDLIHNLESHGLLSYREI
jgi:hypothetical protein